MGDPDLTSEDRRGLVIFPADRSQARAHPPHGSEWWLVVVALALAAVMIAIAFAIR